MLPRTFTFKPFELGQHQVGISAFAFLQRTRHPCLLTGWLWYSGTLVPVIGLQQAGGQAMADRYTYIPSLGLFILVVWGGIRSGQSLAAPSDSVGWSGLRSGCSVPRPDAAAIGILAE